MAWPCPLAMLWLQSITSLGPVCSGTAEGIKILCESKAEPGQGTAECVSLVWEHCWALTMNSL